MNNVAYCLLFSFSNLIPRDIYDVDTYSEQVMHADAEPALTHRKKN